MEKYFHQIEHGGKNKFYPFGNVDNDKHGDVNYNQERHTGKSDNQFYEHYKGGDMESKDNRKLLGNYSQGVRINYFKRGFSRESTCWHIVNKKNCSFKGIMPKILRN